MNFVISIVNPGLLSRMDGIVKSLELPLVIELLGRGTARKDVLDLLGLSTHEYHIFMTIADRECTKRLIDEARRNLYIDAPGQGIIVATPITNPEDTKEIQRQVQELIDKGYVKKSLSLCAVPVLLVPKKDGS